MDVDSSQRRMAAYMHDHQDKVVSRWSELVAAGLRGRSSAAEVRRELDDLYALVVRAMSGVASSLYCLPRICGAPGFFTSYSQPWTSTFPLFTPRLPVS